MLYLNKLLPSLFLPVGLTIVLVSVGLLLKNRNLCWAGLGFFYLLSTAFISGKIMAVFEGAGGRREVKRVQDAEAIVVLSGMLQDRNGAPLGEWSEAVDRFEAGIELFQARKAPLLILTGGHVPWRPDDRPEGEILQERAVKLGIPERRIMVTGKVGNTDEEAKAVMNLFRNSEIGILKQETANGKQGLNAVRIERGGVRSGPRIILVTSAFHMPRAKMLFEKQGFEVEPFPVDFQNSDQPSMTILSFVPSAHALAKSETAMREGIGVLYYSVIKR
jgi:uncharacterized SAM-binding protein YcdF (DUF218 family)